MGPNFKMKSFVLSTEENFIKIFFEYLKVDGLIDSKLEKNQEEVGS